MARVEAAFVLDPNFEYNLNHFIGEPGLNPVGDVVRAATNKIARRAKSIAITEASHWEAQAAALEDKKKSRNHKSQYLRAKALAYSLKKYANLVSATMQKGASKNYGAVLAGHAAGVQIEWGGRDLVLLVGEDRLEYPGFSILRRALNG